MSLLSLFGLENKVEKIPLTFEEYFSRWIRIKSLIENNEQVMKNINNAFAVEYLKQKPNQELIKLGYGNSHIVYSISSEKFRDKDNETMLALRLLRGDNKIFYRLKTDDEDDNYNLFSELDSFCKAFVLGKNSAYFLGLVEWKDTDKFQKGVVGFLTEDVTERKTFESHTKKEGFDEYLEVKTIKSNNKFFIDKVCPDGYTMDVLKYKKNIIKINY